MNKAASELSKLKWKKIRKSMSEEQISNMMKKVSLSRKKVIHRTPIDRRADGKLS